MFMLIKKARMKMISNYDVQQALKSNEKLLELQNSFKNLSCVVLEIHEHALKELLDEIVFYRLNK